jgi:Mg2+ and Co2+ transporter CorA
MKLTLLEYLDKLHLSSTEDEVIEMLKKIMKNFASTDYKAIIMANPYFKSLVLDLKGDIIKEMTLMMDLIKIEIENLNDQLSKVSSTADFLKLKDLRRECVFLLTELEARQNDLYLLF